LTMEAGLRDAAIGQARGSTLLTRADKVID
jgi:hypothetical protein